MPSLAALVASAPARFDSPKATPMTLDKAIIRQLAEHLETAELNARPVTKITDAYPQLNCDDAYAIQAEIRRLKEGRGQKGAGLKAGMTSRAMMKQMGEEPPGFGLIFAY